MLEGFILSTASMISGGTGPYFHEAQLQIPAGRSSISTEFMWNAVSFQSADGLYLPELQYEHEGQTYTWSHAEELEDHNEQALELLFVGEPRNQIILQSPENMDVIAHFFNTKIPGEHLEARFDPFDEANQGALPTGTLDELPQYVSRADWGADESLRVWRPTRGILKFFRKNLPEADQVPKAYQPEIIQETNDKGQRLTWPLEKNKVLKKFVVHHTAEIPDASKHPYELMRAIYYYHTITKGWGDIGYNYVIDQQGNIYEGRAGGPEIVGAHTYEYNLGTLGISLMGNFQYEHPTPNQIKVLTLLIADHANRFNLNPSGRNFWLGQNEYNISGHRDVSIEGHGTACPGINLYNLLPSIRAESAKIAAELRSTRKTVGRDFLKNSKLASQYQRHVDRSTNKPQPIEQVGVPETTIIPKGQALYVDMVFKNNTANTWSRGDKMTLSNLPEGTVSTSFRLTETTLPGSTGTFRARIGVKTTPNGKYNLQVTPSQALLEGLEETVSIEPFTYPIQISGGISHQKAITSQTVSSYQNLKSGFQIQQENKTNHGPDTKIKLSYFDQNYADITADKSFELWSGGMKLKTLAANTNIKVIPTNRAKIFKVELPSGTQEIQNPQFKTSGVLQIKNYDRGLGSVAYNRFRSQLNFYNQGDKNFYIVNQLPLETYLWGLSEQPSTEPNEKKHAIHILARSYAYVYGGDKRKFKTIHYDLEDSPETSQFYLGYDWELYHPEQKALVAETQGLMLTYQDQPVIGPYFTQSNGQSSSAWTGQYPWTVGRELPYDKGLEPKGHGIGLSGNSARKLAEQGADYIGILDYFYTDTSVKKVY